MKNHCRILIADVENKISYKGSTLAFQIKTLL